MELLTHEEYRAMAAEMDFATTAFVDGGYRPALSGETFETLDPATGDKLADVAACAAQDVDF